MPSFFSLFLFFFFLFFFFFFLLCFFFFSSGQEAFQYRIWLLEEAKLQRLAQAKEPAGRSASSRRAGGSGQGRSRIVF